jgi:polyisoprenoid-binding protein YceI
MFMIGSNSLPQRALLHLLLGCAWLRPAPQPRTTQELQRFALDSVSSRIGFEADATLGGFRGHARKITGWVERSQPDLTDARGQIEVDAASFQTGIGLRDRHLRSTLETQIFPTIRFVLDSARFEHTDSAGQAWYRLHGQLTVRNVTRTPEVLARIAVQGDSISADGRIAMRFTDLDMKPPTRMLGTTRVKNDFTITFHCIFVARPASAADTVDLPPERAIRER